MSQTVFLVVVAIILALICLIRLLFALWRYSKWTMLDVILIAIFSVGTQVVAAVFCGGIGSYFSSSYCRLCWVLAVFSALWYLYVFPDKWAPMNISTIFIYIFTFFPCGFARLPLLMMCRHKKKYSLKYNRRRNTYHPVGTFIRMEKELTHMKSDLTTMMNQYT